LALAEQRENVSTAMTKIEECRHCLNTPSAKNNFCEPCCNNGSPLPDHLSALF
jgi:hypothetical protein